MMPTPRNCDVRGDWIALPGLFEQHELVETHEIELKACPLLQVDGRVYYGVYVRDREALRARSVA